jgi:hypothetical protein
MFSHVNPHQILGMGIELYAVNEITVKKLERSILLRILNKNGGGRKKGLDSLKKRWL